MRLGLRDALRVLRRAPVFSSVAIGTLALAIGSTTAVFSVVDAILLRGLPYADAGRLRVIYERNENELRVPSYPTFRDWQTQGAASSAIEGFAFIRGNGVSIPGPDGPDERHVAAYVTPGFFQLLGTRPMLGRTFLPEDELPGAPRIAVISHAFYMKQFGGDRAVLGKRITIDSVPTTIVGVMPRGFAYPNFGGGGGGWWPAAVWQPIAVFEATNKALTLRGLHVDSRTIVRLRSGADSAQAAAAMRTIAQRLATEYPVEQAHWTSVALRTMSGEMFGQLSSTLVLIMGAIGLVFLLACANVANLMLVRSSVRSRELALRAALGASRWRLARHLIAEASVVAVLAGVAGTGLSFALVSALRPYAEQRLPLASTIAVDWRSVAIAAGLSAATALLIGLLPVLHAGRADLVARLRGGPGATVDSGGAPQRRVRDLLVALQIALAITVLVGAGLLVQSVRRVATVPLGYDPSGVVSFSMAPPRSKYESPAEAAALYQRIINGLRVIPSVETVAAAGGALLPTRVEANDQRTDAAPHAAYHPISAEYLRTRRIPIVAGRGFTEEDMRVPSGFLVTEVLAKQLWPNRSAIGQRITVRRSSQARADFGQPITLPIVGVVKDYRELGPEQDAPPQVFLPYTLEVWPWMNFIVRSPRADAILGAVTDVLKEVEPALEIRGKPSVQKTGASFTDPRVFVTTLLGGFAATALLLAAIGLYGIVAFSVAQRTRELGVRIAMGATPRAILKLVMTHAAKLVIAGVVVGLAAATLVTGTLRTLLFQTSTTDTATFIVVPLVLSVVAAVASVVPAYRASRTDPLIVIKSE